MIYDLYVHLQNEFKLIKHLNVMLFKHNNIWKMIIYLFTFEALQHIGTHIN